MVSIATLNTLCVMIKKIAVLVSLFGPVNKHLEKSMLVALKSMLI